MQALRRTVRAAAPGARECISYGIPALTLDERPFVWYAVWKDHCSLYPVPSAFRSRTELKAHATAKGTVRIPLDEPLPARFIGKLVRALAAERGRRSAGVVAKGATGGRRAKREGS